MSVSASRQEVIDKKMKTQKRNRELKKIYLTQIVQLIILFFRIDNYALLV